MDKSNLILIDFSWLYNKYYFVSSYTITQEFEGEKPQDELELRLYGMLSQFLKRMGECYPDSRIFCVLDSPTSTLKNKDIFDGYKQNRDKEAKKEVYSCLNRIIKALANFLPKSFSFIKAKHYEADQIISYMIKKYGKDRETIIFSGDKDLIQLTAYPNVKTSDKFEKGKFIIRTDVDLFAKFKNSKGEDFTRISTNKRDILKYRVLKGDPSDNLSPVFPRIRDTEIGDIIKECWTSEDYLTEDIMDAVVESVRVTNTKLADKLGASKDTWLRNYKIMDLFYVDDIEVKELR